MWQYVANAPGLRRLIDFVDVDSEKWREYSASAAWPMSVIYGLEASRLRKLEREAAGRADASFFVTADEAALFRRIAPESAGKVHVLGNGVDCTFFSPDTEHPSPFGPDERPIVLTGAMGYWPNVDGARWFVDEILPIVQAAEPRVRFYVVGMNPAPAVIQLARAPGVAVTGTVPDVRPYLKHAHLVVVPLRIARGVQNKILEAMAMARPVVASEACARPLSVRQGEEIETAADAVGFARKIIHLLRDSRRAQALGRAARARVLADFAWGSTLERLDGLLSAPARVSGVLHPASDQPAARQAAVR
jgi:sugar transferase (PEP-CTERM/EpsH1 system associated)